MNQKDNQLLEQENNSQEIIYNMLILSHKISYAEFNLT